MQYVKFGSTGMDVSRICLGMMSFGKPGKENGVFPWAKDYEDGKEMFKKAVDLGSSERRRHITQERDGGNRPQPAAARP